MLQTSLADKPKWSLVVVASHHLLTSLNSSASQLPPYVDFIFSFYHPILPLDGRSLLIDYGLGLSVLSVTNNLPKEYSLQVVLPTQKFLQSPIEEKVSQSGHLLHVNIQPISHPSMCYDSMRPLSELANNSSEPSPSGRNKAN